MTHPWTVHPNAFPESTSHSAETRAPYVGGAAPLRSSPRFAAVHSADVTETTVSQAQGMTIQRLLLAPRTRELAAFMPGDYLTDGLRLLRVAGRLDTCTGRPVAILEDCLTLDTAVYAPAELESMALQLVLPVEDSPADSMARAHHE